MDSILKREWIYQEHDLDELISLAAEFDVDLITVRMAIDEGNARERLTTLVRERNERLARSASYLRSLGMWTETVVRA